MPGVADEGVAREGEAGVALPAAEAETEEGSAAGVGLAGRMARGALEAGFTGGVTPE